MRENTIMFRKSHLLLVLLLSTCIDSYSQYANQRAAQAECFQDRIYLDDLDQKFYWRSPIDTIIKYGNPKIENWGWTGKILSWDSTNFLGVMAVKVNLFVKKKSGLQSVNVGFQNDRLSQVVSILDSLCSGGHITLEKKKYTSIRWELKDFVLGLNVAKKGKPQPFVLILQRKDWD